LLGGCASGDSLAGQRTVFSTPYAATIIDSSGIGPGCETQFGRDATCLGAPLIIARRGRVATLSTGQTIPLTRNQVRILHERAALIEALRQQPPPSSPPPPPPAPPPPAPVIPTADDAADRS
jgi:hypothetical protein